MENYSWDDECAYENDERIIKLEADIADLKASLNRMNAEEDEDLF